MLLMASAASAQVTVEARIDSLQLLIGEQAKIKLEVSMDAGQKLQLPFLKDTLVRGVEILDIAKPDTQLLNDKKRWLISQEYTVTSFDSALYYLPPFEVMVDNQAYRSEALALKVYSIPVDTLHPDQFFGPKDVREVPIVWKDVAPLVYSGLCLLILGALAVFLIIRYRDNKPIIKIIKVEPKLPPHQTAMKKIEEIKADKQVQREDPKLYYTELTDVLRTYIWERFGFNAIAREYIRPAYVSDDEVDENGNPLPDEDTEAPANDEAGQVPIEASVVSEEDTADETGDDNETKTK